jgi:integrase
VTERQSHKRPAKRCAWSYIAGEKGRNRVRVYERGGYGIWIDYRTEDGSRERHSLGHADHQRAKLEADEIAARFSRAAARPAATVTLRTLFDIYEREVTPQKAPNTQAYDRRILPLFLKAFGTDRRPETLNRRDWDSYIQRRRCGQLAPANSSGEAVRDRVIEQDLKLLLAVLNWAERAGSNRGSYLLDRNPLKGLEIPKEQSPRRPILSGEQFLKLRAGAKSMSCRAELFAVLAWYTGHRSASIRQLRWSDIDLEGARIHWRGEVDKIGYDHWNPLHPVAAEVLKLERSRVAAIGDGWVFDVKGEPLSRQGVRSLWRRIAEKAGIPDTERHGWHSCRRAFANGLRHASLRDLKDLGGWKSEQTVVSVYQQPSESAQREALLGLDSGAKKARTGTRNGHTRGRSQNEIPATA